jgi:hypothetical protein
MSVNKLFVTSGLVTVTTPSIGTTSTSVSALGDVDLSELRDGAVLQWNNNTKKWTSRTEIKTETGELVLNAGFY